MLLGGFGFPDRLWQQQYRWRREQGHAGGNVLHHGYGHVFDGLVSAYDAHDAYGSSEAGRFGRSLRLLPLPEPLQWLRSSLLLLAGQFALSKKQSKGKDQKQRTVSAPHWQSASLRSAGQPRRMSHIKT